MKRQEINHAEMNGCIGFDHSYEQFGPWEMW